ncbi:MAG TPA: hypothetical protein VF821_22615 [Lentzea sp.]
MKPTDALVPPEAVGAVPSSTDDLMSCADWLNVSHSVMKLAEAIFGVNPGQWYVDRIIGNWSAYGRAGSAMVNLGKFYTAYGQTLAEQKNVLMTSWHGHAATAADAYFANLADAIKAQQDSLTQIGEELHGIAYRMWTLSKLLDSQLELLLDVVLEAFLAAAVGTATVETGVGAVAGYALAALRIKKAESIWMSIIEAHDKAYNYFLASRAVISAAMTKMRTLTEHPLPQGAYDHPGV